MNITFFWTIYYAMMGIEFLVLIPFILNYKLLDTTSRYILYYIGSSVIFSVGADLLQWLYYNNMWFFNLMHFVQFVVLSFFYYHSIKNLVLKKVIQVMPFILAGIFALDIFVIEGIEAYNSISAGVKSIIILIYGVILFLQLLNDKNLIENSIYIDSLPVFWYNSGIFIYFCTIFLFNISYNLLQAQAATGNSKLNIKIAVLSISNIVAIISMILLYIGFSKLKKLRYADS